jgi:hypothetical protein
MVTMNRKVKALLDRRTDQVFPDNEDLLVDMYSAPLWMQRQMYLRAKLMAIEEGYDGLCWPEQGRVGEYAGLACQGSAQPFGVPSTPATLVMWRG